MLKISANVYFPIFSERRCLNPYMPGMPALSTFRNNSSTSEMKKKATVNVFRTATAVATKSVPPPPPTPPPYEPLPPAECTNNVQQLSSIENSTTIQPEPSSQSPDITMTEETIEEKSPENVQESEKTPEIPNEAQRKPWVESEESKAKPNMSYAGLIALALDSLPEKRGKIQHIYQYLSDRFPYFRESETLQWQNSIRHNLSIHKDIFLKGAKEGKGSLWRLSPDIDKNYVIKKKSFRDEYNAPKLTDVACKEKENKTLKESKDDKKQTEEPTVTKVVQKAKPSTQSLEDFLEINTGDSQDKSIPLMSALTSERPKQPASILTPPLTSSTSSVSKPKKSVSISNKASVLTYEKEKPCFGSIDYYEQYDPEVVTQNGHAVITTEVFTIYYIYYFYEDLRNSFFASYFLP